MLITTTNVVEGRPVQEYLGVINAQSIIGANIFKDIFAGLRDVFGGRSKTYERVLEQAKEDALRELAEKAQALGANGVLGVDLDFETIGSGGSMLMVIATGAGSTLAHGKSTETDERHGAALLESLLDSLDRRFQGTRSSGRAKSTKCSARPALVCTATRPASERSRSSHVWYSTPP